LDSSDICIHKASDKESAIAIVKIHPITSTLDSLPNANHIISPNVVIIPDVAQKLSPVLMEFFIFLNRFKIYFHRFSLLQKSQDFFFSFYQIMVPIVK